ncbi:MAG: NAD-dependent epimerase/dehydratase family protein [Anaerolineales bacterium]|nr:NAD-dependent epimerase/dehydratase family protein [Anaerolineales bacterium]
MVKALVLGATGFIGGHIAQAAIAAGWEVSGLRRDSTRTGHLGGFPVRWVQGDLNDIASLQTAMERMDVVFHAAAFYPKTGNPHKVPEQIQTARSEIRNVIHAVQVAGVSRVIYTSSLTTIGHPCPHENRLADESDFYRPGTLAKSGYYEAKIAMEKLFLEACSGGLPGVILNPTAVFGPGDMGSLLVAVSRGWMVAWLPGDINVVDVRDAAEAHIAAAQNGNIGERYIIGGHNYPVRDALSLVARVAGVRPPRFEIPRWFLRALTGLGDLIPALPLPTNHLRAVHLWQGYNTQKAQGQFGLSPRPFEDTVCDSLAWFRQNGLL